MSRLGNVRESYNIRISENYKMSCLTAQHLLSQSRQLFCICGMSFKIMHAHPYHWNYKIPLSFMVFMNRICNKSRSSVDNHYNNLTITLRLTITCGSEFLSGRGRISMTIGGCNSPCVYCLSEK